MREELIEQNEYTIKEIEQAFDTNFGARVKGITLRRDTEDNPIILLFTREDGPYNDRQGEGSSFYYDGEGTDKDQELTAANSALIKSIDDERQIFGFRQHSGNDKWSYIGPLEVVDYSYVKKNGFGTYEFHIQSSTDNIGSSATPNLHINRYLLEKHFIAWKEFVEKQDKHRFESFGRSDYVIKSEGYKKSIREQGIRLLNVDNWDKSQVGTGSILRTVISAIEQQNNNLVFTSSHSYTREGSPHKKLLEIDESGETEEIERILFNTFNDLVSDANSFEALIDIAGKRYSLLAFIFYLKNSRRYMPIAPVKFDEIFNDFLHVNFTASHNCSWGNYVQYNNLIAQTAEYLSSRLDEIVTLIDAHSFLWMIANHGDPGQSQSSVTATKISIDREYEFTPPKKRLSFKDSTPRSIADNNKINSINGAKGEYEVLKYELSKERNVDVPISKIRIVSEENSSLGYDVYSFDEDGNEIFIEVKATTAKSSNFIKFNLTRNEYDKCMSKNGYHIYIVNNISDSPNISILNDRLTELTDVFDPTVFPGGLAKPTNAIIKLKILRTS